MKLKIRILALCLVGLCIIQSSVWAETKPVDERPSAAMVIVDVMPMRVIGVAGTLLGSALFLVTFPFTAFSGPNEALYALVVDPFRYTFVRPLGRFDNWEKSRSDTFETLDKSKNNENIDSKNPYEEIPDF